MSGRHCKPRTREPGRHRRPPGPSRFLAPGLIAVALLGAGGVGAHAALSNSGSGASVPAPPAVPEIVSPSPTPSASATPTPGATSAPLVHARRPSYVLKLAITGSVSWVDVRRPDGHVLVSGMVRHGRHLTYRHGPLVVVIGNAGAVTVSRAGPARKAGRPGEVVTLHVPKS